jgi:hypothetical protein
MKTLKEVVTAQGLSNRDFSAKAGISFRAIAEIRSGQWDEAMQNKNGKGYSGRKRSGAIQVMARTLVACGENPQEWIKTLSLTLTPQEEQTLSAATSRRPKPLMAPGLGSEEWNALLTIADKPLRKEDVEQLAKAQDALGDFFTIKLAIELLISKNKK